MSFSRISHATRRRHLVEIYHEVQGADDGSGGFEAATLTKIAEEYAAVEALDARELAFAEQIRSTATHKFIFRQPSAVTTKSQLVWDGRTFHVAGKPKDPDGRKRDLVVRANEAE